MARFILIGFAAIFLMYTLWRIFSGKSMTVLDWALLFVSVVMVGSFISYIIQTN